jgi:hypothetical protein
MNLLAGANPLPPDEQAAGGQGACNGISVTRQEVSHNRAGLAV